MSVHMEKAIKDFTGFGVPRWRALGAVRGEMTQVVPSTQFGAYLLVSIFTHTAGSSTSQCGRVEGREKAAATHGKIIN